MKWFKHETSAHNNLKLQVVIDKFGPTGYGYYWACVELAALQGGEDFTVKRDKEWMIYLKKQLNTPIDDQKNMLVAFANLTLIDGKALKKGDLSIPKLAERADEYTEKVRRKSGQGRDNVGLEENRTEEIRTEQNRHFEDWWKEYPSAKRNMKKSEAEKKFVKGALTAEETLRRLEHLKEQKSSDRKWLKEFPRYVPNMSTYLNGERWNMDIEMSSSSESIKI